MCCGTAFQRPNEITTRHEESEDKTHLLGNADVAHRALDLTELMETTEMSHIKYRERGNPVRQETQ